MKKLTKFESYETAKKRIEAEDEKKEILKRLGDPDLTEEEKNELMERLYDGIEIKE